MTATLETPPPPQLKRNVSLERPQPTWLYPETIVFLAVWFLLIVAGRERLFQDPGTFWHTAVGEQMLATGEAVRHDSFTFTFAGRPWIAHQWLGECLMAAAYRVGGWDTLLLVTATLLAGLYAWIAHRWLQAGVSAAGIVAVLSIVFIASAHHYHVRPHLASIVLLAVSFGILCDVDRGRAPVTRLLWLVPLFALWTNLHGGMLGGLATLAIVVAGWIGARLLQLPSPLKTWRDAALACAVLAACGGTMFLSPFGAEMPGAWMTIMRLSLPDVIQEHGRLDFTRPEAWMVLTLGIGYAALLWRRVWHVAPRRDASRSEAAHWRVTWLIPLIWFCLACDRVRHAPLFAVVAAVAGAELLARSARCVLPGTRRAIVVPAVLLALCLTLQSAGLRVPLVGAGWARLDRNVWPIDLLDDLRSLENQTEETPIFNALHYGGFLALHTPGLRTFIDDRCELFGDAFLREYARAEAAEPELVDHWRQEHQFGHALVRAGTPFDRYLAEQSDWRLLRRTPAAALYVFAINDR